MPVQGQGFSQLNSRQEKVQVEVHHAHDELHQGRGRQVTKVYAEETGFVREVPHRKEK